MGVLKHNSGQLYTLLIIVYLWLISGVALASDNPRALVDEIVARGNAIVETYQPESGVLTGNALSRLYFDVFESKGLEFIISQHSQNLLLEIESLFSGMIGLSMSNKSNEALNGAWARLRAKLEIAAQLDVAESGGSWQSSFITSLILLLREGVEALLIIALLFSYMRSSGVADYQWVLKLGVGLALLASVAVAVILQLFFASQAARQRELLEGVTLLTASGLMVYVSHWLMSRKEAMRWQSFIKEALQSAVDKRKLWVLGSVAFFAVFREGAETVLFYAALTADGGQSIDALVAGAATACLVLVALYIVFMRVSIKLPINTFFTVSAILLYGLAVSFAGKGVLELQLAGWIPSTLVVSAPTVTWIGIFPTLESIALQTFLLMLIPAGYMWSVSFNRFA